MSNKLFQQNLDDKKGPQPGGPYLIQMLFKEPVDMPDKDEMTAVMEKHIGAVECFCRDKKMAGFAALDHIAEFQDGKCPVQLMVMKCDRFKGKGFDAFLMSQMWDCQEDRDRIFRECRYQVVATDMLTAALPALERANLDADFVEALAEPTSWRPLRSCTPPVRRSISRTAASSCWRRMCVPTRLKARIGSSALASMSVSSTLRVPRICSSIRWA